MHWKPGGKEEFPAIVPGEGREWVEYLLGKMQHGFPTLLVGNPSLEEGFPVVFKGHQECGRGNKIILWNP